MMLDNYKLLLPYAYMFYLQSYHFWVFHIQMVYYWDLNTQAENT